MRIVTVACMVTIALLSCDQPTDPETVYVETPAPEPAEEPVAEEPDEEPADEPEEPVTPEEPPEPEPTPEPEPEPIPEPEPEPAWQPEPHTVYILDGADEIYLQSTTDDPDHFRSLCSAWQGAVESYNTKRNKPGPYPYRFVAGEAP